MLGVLDEIRNLSSWYENWKNDPKKLRKKQKFMYPDKVMTKMMKIPWNDVYSSRT